MPVPKRKRLRPRPFDYSALGAYFVTICARRRACIFGEIVDERIRPSELGQAAVRCWHEIPAHFPSVDLDAFVLMPNHIHGIVLFFRAGHARPLPVVIGSIKSAVTRMAGRPIWQRGYYDRVIRDDAELEALRQYIADNPVKCATDHENPDCWGGS